MDARIRLALAPPLLAAAFTLTAGPCPAAAADDPDVRLLEKGGLGADDDFLIEFLRNHSGGDVDAAAIDRIVRQLGDDRFAVREAAVRHVLAWGQAALPALRRAAR